ncbi:hypothetical protein ACJ7VZ_05370 [Aeromonas salmonicida]|uniref:hypothetical protein n=1 Tax=Aeromonas salmonicida TaxID=645 RepID=UPI0038B88A56
MDMIVKKEWISINKATGILVGEEFIISNKSFSEMVLQESSTQPDANDFSGPLLTMSRTYGSQTTCKAGSKEAWIRVFGEETEIGTINVQAV